MPLGDVQKFSNRPKRHRWSGPLRRHMWLSFWETPPSLSSISLGSNKFLETDRRTSRLSLWLPLLMIWLFHNPITLWFSLWFNPQSELMLPPYHRFTASPHLSLFYLPIPLSPRLLIISMVTLSPFLSIIFMVSLSLFSKSAIWNLKSEIRLGQLF